MKTNFSKISGPGEGKWKSLLKFISFLLTKQGSGVLKRALSKRLQRSGVMKQDKLNYDKWIRTLQDINVLKQDFEATSNALKVKPRIKIVVPSPEIPTEHLEATRDSILAQQYRNFDEVLFADAPTLKDIRKESSAGAPPNSQLHSADCIFFVTPGCLLTPNCLYEFIRHINAHPEDDIVYADDDLMTDDTSFSSPYFKPDWSPDTFLSRNYIGSTVLIKKQLIDRLELPAGYEFTDIYDLLLRATEQTNHIGHIPKVLVHKRARISPGAEHAGAKKALEAALERRGRPAQVLGAGVPEVFNINYAIRSVEKVSIIIPTKDGTALLKTAIDSIFQKTDYPDYEIILLNNNSSSPEFFSLVKQYTAQYAGKFSCIDANFPFNFAKLMNAGVAASKGAYILMCNNDIEVTHADWMTQMVSYAQHPETGAVGVKLLYPDDTVQHAGIVSIGARDTGHVFVGMTKNKTGYFNSLIATTNYSSVTAACLMCRKNIYEAVGGMDEALAVEYNDVDLCLKFRERGYYNVYLASAALYHHESATRGHPLRSKESFQQHEKELAIFKSKWPAFIERDSFYSAHLGLDGGFMGGATV